MAIFDRGYCLYPHLREYETIMPTESVHAVYAGEQTADAGLVA